MRVLWTVNSLLPEVAKQLNCGSSHAISWVDAMSKRLTKRDDIVLAMATTSSVKNVERHIVGKVTYYLLPKNCAKVDYWNTILKEFKPDIIHAYGTEHDHNVLLIQKHNEIPIIGSLQGILSEYQRHYYGGIDFSTMLRYTTFQDLFSGAGFFSGRNRAIKKSELEKTQLRNLSYVEGRSTWDRVSALNINPDLHYYYCPRMIREPFFSETWDINKIERHSIFVSQALSPLKGLHFVLMAIAKLKNKYPDIKLYVAGYDRLHPRKFRQKISCGGYINYLKHLIKDINVQENVVFTGSLTAGDMAIRTAKSHVVVIPSSIENAPNSLAEAEIVGTPTIASFVGGNMDMLKHNEEGFLYCFNEPNMLAEYIRQIFENDQLTVNFSNNAKTMARRRHDPRILEETLLDIYKNVLLMSNNKK